MAIDDPMTIDERRKYLRTMQRRYLQASTRTARGVLLKEMELVTGLDRKTLIRAMSDDLQRQPRRKQRGHTYGATVVDALRVIAESWDYIAAERLTPNLVWMATHLEQHGELRTSPLLLEQLGAISISTVARLMKQITQDEPRLPRRGPESANRYTQEVPMKRIPWDEPVPGHFEADLVHHSGPYTTGEYIHTLQLIDVTTGWSERVAVLGRSYVVMQNAFQRILTRLPFPVLEIHPDNGSEFFNEHMRRFWPQAFPTAERSRSRPFHKNDNRFVEQKNDTLVRAYLQHARFDTVAQTLAINALYDQLWVYYNLFQPVMRLSERTFVKDDEGGSHLHRKFDQARTPFERLCATGILSPQRRQELEQRRTQTNPRRLRQQIRAQLDALFDSPLAVPGVSEDVYATLFQPIPTEKGDGLPR